MNGKVNNNIMKFGKSTILQALILIGIGIVIGLLIYPLSKETKPSEISSSAKIMNTTSNKSTLSSESEQLENINQLLASEIEAREELQRQLATLQNQFNLFRGSSSAAEVELPGKQQQIISTRQSRIAMTQDRSWFNEAALLEVGIDETEARRLREMYEKNEMDRLYLRDQAIREGWLGKSRYVNEMQALNSQIAVLQEDLDEETYDAYLYASGKANRVVVDSTLSNSPAAKAGLAPGDVILKYNNKRIYTAGKLRELTTQGEPNSVVSVELIRNGKLVTVYLPIGPLGIRMNSRSVAPNSE